MRTKLALAFAVVAAAATFGPVSSASAVCDPQFFEQTGYCSPCHLMADKTQRPEPVFCPQ